MAGVKAFLKSMVPPSRREAADHLFARVTSPLHWGNNVECVACGRTFRHYLSNRADEAADRCPYCRSQSRHRMLRLFFESRPALLPPGARLLHMAPEPLLQGKLREWRDILYVGADIRSPRANVWCDITRLPFPTNSFSGILCSHVLEHIPDDRAAMCELHRVLAPGGWAVLPVPLSSSASTHEDASITSPAERAKHFGQWDHVRLYGRDYRDRLEAAGFRVEMIEFAASYTDEQCRRFGLSRSELLPFATKA